MAVIILIRRQLGMTMIRVRIRTRMVIMIVTECLLPVSYSSKYFASINSFNSPNNPMR